MKLYKDLIRQIVTKYGDKIGVICKKQPGITHRQMDLASNAIIAGLYDLGLSRGDTIALYMGNNYHYREMFWVAGKGGFVLVPINGRFKPQEAAYIINNSKAKCLIISKELDNSAAQIRDELKLVKHFFGVDKGIAGYRYMGDLVATYPSDDLTVPLADDDLLWLQHTSGTTGFPKAVMLTQGNAYSIAEIGGNVAQAAGKFTEKTRFLQCVPSYTFAGSGWDIVGQRFGAQTVIMDRFDAAKMMAIVEKYKISDTHIVPVMLHLILNSPEFGRYDLSSLKTITIGAAPVSSELIRRGIEMIGPIFLQDYGASESGIVTLMDYNDIDMNGSPEMLKRLESCGVAVEGVDAKIIDSDGMEARPGHMGELTVKSPLVMKGYWKMPEETAKVLEKGRYYTGDLATADEAGYIFIKDRQKDMIISGGFNIYPSEIEQELVKHPAVLDVAVFGIPDDKWGESVCAYVILNHGKVIDEAGLIEFAKNNMASFKKPKKIVFVENLPRSTSGKVLKKELRYKYWQGRDKKV